MDLGLILFAIVLLILAGDGFFKIKTAWEFRKGGKFNPLPDKVHPSGTDAGSGSDAGCLTASNSSND